MAQKQSDTIERVSAISLTKIDGPIMSPTDSTPFAQVKTPTAGQFEGGALRSGGAPNIYSWEHVGLLVHYFGAGLIYSCVFSIVYPFLNNYLHMSGVATASASVLTALPYTFKMFFGIISDCFPIMGYRRRPYMLIGWVVCTVAFFVMAVLPTGDPYYSDTSLRKLDPATLTDEQMATINLGAPANGTKFVLLLIVANLGMVLAASAVGGTLVELSQREPEAVRGTAQTMIWVARDAGGVVANALVGFGLNSDEFGGSFAGSIGVHAIMWICMVVGMLTGLSAWYNVTEEKCSPRPFTSEISKLWTLIQKRAVYQILAFKFFTTLFTSISVTAANPIKSTWAGVEPVNNSIASIAGKTISAVTLVVVAKYGLQWSWRNLIIFAEILTIVLDVFPTFLTIWDVVRSQWFWLGVPLLEEVPSNISFIVATFCMVEIMDEGNEAAFYGLVVSVSTLASPFSTVITKNVDANFDIAYADIQRDDHDARMQATYAYLFQYACNLFSLVFVLLLPRQKAETQELKRTGGSSFIIGGSTVVLLTFVFVWSIMTNLMSIFPSTACYKIAGGTGC